MRRAANTPSEVRAAKTVVFGPRLRGAWAEARCPRGAHPYRGVRAKLHPLSSTKTSAWGSNSAWAWARQAARSSSSRSLALKLIFFVTPVQDVPQDSGEGGPTDPNAVLLAQALGPFD